MQNKFKDKIIVVTGGTGAIGSNIVYQLLKFQPKQIRVISRDENKQYYLKLPPVHLTLSFKSGTLNL